MTDVVLLVYAMALCALAMTGLAWWRGDRVAAVMCLLAMLICTCAGVGFQRLAVEIEAFMAEMRHE